MDETRRFLRYILPGVAATLEFCLLDSLFDQIAIKALSAVLFSDSGFNISVPISALLITAGLGYLFSLMHHVLLWTVYEWPPWALRWTPDYRPLLRHAEREGWLTVTRLDTGAGVRACCLCTAGAWRLVNALWHQMLRSSDRIRSANRRLDSLSDIAHGTGAAFVGSLVATMLWLLVAYRAPQGQLCSAWFFVAIGVAALMILVHGCGVYIVLRHSESFVQMVMGDALREAKSKRGRPTECTVTKRDFKLWFRLRSWWQML